MLNKEIIGLTLVELFLLLLFSILLCFTILNTSSDKLETLNKNLIELSKKNNLLTNVVNEKNEVIDKQKKEIVDLKERLVYLQENPPLIIWDESKGIHFDTGSADISKFENILIEKISSIDDKLYELKSNKYIANTIEIIGHTDAAIISKKGNLDTELETMLLQDGDMKNLICGSNADLGLMRALAIALFIKNRIKDKDIIFKVYSAAQLILPNGKLITTIDRKPDANRRRIEIRFTKSKIE